MGTTTTGLGGFTTVLTLTEAATGLSNLATAYGTHMVTMDANSTEFAVVYCKYVKGAETSMQVRCEVSEDGGTTYRNVPYITNGTGAAGSQELSKTATGNFRMVIPLIGRQETKLRVNAKATGNSDATTSMIIAVSLAGARQPLQVS